MRGTALGAASFGWAMVVALATASSTAADECARRISAPVVRGETIALAAAPEMPPGLLIAAIGYWEACAGYGETFPRLVEGGSGTRVVNVRYVRGASRARHCGTFHGTTITLYAAAVANGKPVFCGSLEQNLAHEIGHVLGLDDVESPSCRRRIMSMIEPHSAVTRRVHPEECALVGHKWLTFLEAGDDATASGSQASNQMTQLVLDVGRQHRLSDLFP